MILAGLTCFDPVTGELSEALTPAAIDRLNSMRVVSSFQGSAVVKYEFEDADYDSLVQYVNPVWITGLSLQEFRETSQNFMEEETYNSVLENDDSILHEGVLLISDSLIDADRSRWKHYNKIFNPFVPTPEQTPDATSSLYSSPTEMAFITVCQQHYSSTTFGTSEGTYELLCHYEGLEAIAGVDD